MPKLQNVVSSVWKTAKSVLALGYMQIQSNALAALQAIDPMVAEEIMSHGCITGDRINGLCDGVSGDW
jgi:hypothetical protein